MGLRSINRSFEWRWSTRAVMGTNIWRLPRDTDTERAIETSIVGTFRTGSTVSLGSGAKPISISNSSGSETNGMRGDPPGEIPGWGLKDRIMGDGV